jgi:outer membrane protein assembly factor BamB
MASDAVLNAMDFGDVQGNSFLPVTAELVGSSQWSAPLPPMSQPRAPISLAVIGQTLIANFGSHLAAYDSENGTLIWDRPIRGNHLFTMIDEGICVLDRNAYLKVVGPDGSETEGTFLPNVKPEFFLLFVQPTEDGWIYCVEETPVPLSEPTDDPEPAVSRCKRYQPETIHTVWEYLLPTNLIGVRSSGDMKWMYAASPDSLFIMTTAASSENPQPLTVPMPGIKSLSVDFEGRGLVMRAEGKQAVLACIGTDGTVQWETTFDKAVFSRQPVASTPDGVHYVVAGQALQQIRNGEVTWSHTLTVPPDSVGITALTDNSVLVTAGQTLVHFDSNGAELSLTKLGVLSTTRPIVDHAGRVYFGSADGINCLK